MFQERLQAKDLHLHIEGNVAVVETLEVRILNYPFSNKAVILNARGEKRGGRLILRQAENAS